MLTIVPVLDLKDDHVVRGMAGKRQEYRPIVSQLTTSSVPGEVAAALAKHFAFTQAYVADLDAIAGAAPQQRHYTAIQNAGLRLWIDAGNLHLKHVAPHGDVVLGLESLRDPAHLRQCLELVADRGAIFSLDLNGGKPWTTAAAWQGMSAVEIAASAVACGIERMILLDVASVGMNAGPRTLELAVALHRQWPQLELIGGGGVRHLEDLYAMEAAGFTHALVASALHDGRLISNQLPGGQLRGTRFWGWNP